MTFSASETYQHLIKKLHGSNLHFLLTETPFSAQILIRKRFLKGELSPKTDFYSHEASSGNNVGDYERKQIQELQETIESLEQKLAGAEAQSMKAFEEKMIEINALKKALKNGEDEKVTIQKALEAKNRELKERDKLVKKLEQKQENMNINIKNLKSELTKAKSENKKLHRNKSSNTKMDPVLTTSSKVTEDVNRNTLSPRTYPSPSRTPPGTPSTSSNSSRVSNHLSNDTDAMSALNLNSHPSKPYLKTETVGCIICDETFSKVELLRVHTEHEHDIKLCPVKLTDHEEKEPFVRFFESMEFTEAYLESRKNYYPEDWGQVETENRIKFRKLAQLKLKNTSQQIEQKMEKTDFLSITNFCGMSCDDSNLIT